MRVQALFAALFTLFAFPALAAQEPQCTSQAEVIHTVAERFPEAKYAIYTGQEAAEIQAGMASMGSKLEGGGERVFILFTNGSGVDLLVGIYNGCYEGSAQIPHELIDGWLAGEGA
jgi:hypothetical protein